MKEIFLPPFQINAEYTIKASETNEYQWDKVMVGIDKLHNAGLSGKGLKIGILDTGLRDKGHDDFNYESVVAAQSFTKETVIDGHGHGTWVNGAISAKLNNTGVVGGAYNAEIYVAKVLENSGNGGLIPLVKGTQWLIEKGCHIINGSLGFGNSQIVENYRYVLNEGIKSGVVFVFASGNGGKKNEIDFPSVIDNVFSVGAIDSSGRIASFSNKGIELDVVAPGVNVLGISKVSGGFVGMSGTSQASPLVTSFLACYMEHYKAINNRFPSFEEIYLEITKKNTKDLGSAGLDPSFGYGMVYPFFLDKPEEPIVCPELDLAQAKKMVYDDLKSKFSKAIYKIIT